MINFRLALRSLAKTPLVTGVAILSLALGIGANAAIFSIFQQMLLKSLPAASPGELVNLKSPGPKMGSQSTTNAGDDDSIFSYPMFRDLEKAATGFSGLAAHCAFPANLAYGKDTLSASGLFVSGGYFEVLGLQPAAGRLIARQDDLTPGAHPVVVLSHAYWRTRFNSSPDIVGQSLVVNGLAMNILGVAPRGFTGTTLGWDPQVFVPISMRSQIIPGWEGFDNRRTYWIYLFARLAPGTSREEAATATNVVYRQIVQDVEVPLQEGMSESRMKQFRTKEILLEPGWRGQSSLHAEIQTPLLMLLGVSAFVLLIACANIANLLLVKAMQRTGEIAIRLSIGAQRHQVVTQLLTESFVLTALGGLAGFLVAQETLRLIASLLPPESHLGLAFTLGPAAWVFLAVLALVTGLVGLFPALHSTREDLALLLRSQAGRTSASRTAQRFRTSLVTLQIALAMALLISAGLFTRSLVNVTRVDLGIDVLKLATFGISPELNHYTPEEARGLFARVEDELRALPGVTGVAASMVPLISGSNWGTNVTVQGFAADPDTDTHSRYNEVGPDYFRTLGISLLAGREFEARDTLGAPKVAVVNEAFARKFNLGQEAVGKRMRVGGRNESEELDIEIVGFVRDAKYSEVKQEVPPLFFLPYRQNEKLGSINFYVRTAGEPVEILPTLRGVVSRLDPQLPIETLQALEVQVRANVFLDRLLSKLSAAFAILATILAAIGLYGVMAYSVAQRTREIGLRMALGADAGRVRQLILRQVGWMTLAGATLGILASLGLGRIARSLLFGLESHDPWVFAGATLTLALIALVAGLLPARRAAAIEPTKALRSE